MNTVALSRTIDLPWLDIVPTRLGSIPATLGTPDLHVLVSSAHGPFRRLDLYADRHAHHAFQAAKIWCGFVAVGFGERLHLVELETGQAIELELGSYFGSLWAEPRCLLVSSAERMFCIEVDGSLRWQSPPLGIDGVVVHEVSDGTVRGDGEWDPPGGWRPFRLSLDDGSLLPLN